MGSNGNPESDAVVNPTAGTARDPSTQQSKSDDPSQETQPTTTTSSADPNSKNDSSPAQPDDTTPSQPPPPTQPSSQDPAIETLPSSTDKDAPASPTEDAQKTLSHTESLELKFSTAIGPSSDHPEPPCKESDETGPTLVLTLLLTTGARHPFKIDGKYLRKRSVNVDNNDPFSMSVYTLKELIWREWRQEWETRPASPTSIRLISFGKLLDDKAPLSDSKLNPDAPNVLHMTVKPQELVEEEDAKGGKTSYGREQEVIERSPRCRCVIL